MLQVTGGDIPEVVNRLPESDQLQSAIGRQIGGDAPVAHQLC